MDFLPLKKTLKTHKATCCLPELYLYQNGLTEDLWKEENAMQPQKICTNLTCI
jgi:hypothetical protein